MPAVYVVFNRKTIADAKLEGTWVTKANATLSRMLMLRDKKSIESAAKSRPTAAVKSK
jgi:hypothetical protein